jgi:hypothetical protein
MFVVNDHKSAIIGSKSSQRSSMSSQNGGSVRQSPTSSEVSPFGPESTGFLQPGYKAPILFIDEIYENLEDSNFQDKNNNNNRYQDNNNNKYQDSKFNETTNVQTPCNKNQWGLQISALIAITQLLSDFKFMERLLHYNNGDREVVIKYAVYVILRKFSEQPLGGNTPNYTSIKWICAKVLQYLERCSR